MPDILLIQPPIRDFYLTAKRTIPYGLACLASVLEKDGFSVAVLDGLAKAKARIIDYPSELEYLNKYYGESDRSPFALFQHFKHFGYSFDHIGRQAKASQAFLIGISSLFTPYMGEVIQTAESVKSFHPDCKIVVGGHHATAMPETVLQSPAVDFVLRGEGEVSISLLAKAVAGNTALETVPGIAYRQDDGRIHVNPPARMPNPDNFPLPAVHLLNNRFYQRHKKGSMVITASRGCPMKCTYCAVGTSSPLDYRRRSVAGVLQEIKTAVECYGAGFIDFEDENLSLDRSWFLELLAQLRHNFKAGQLELRAMNGLFPQSLDEEVVSAMKAAGFQSLNLSLCSISGDQLKRFQRPDVRRGFERALTLAEKYGLDAVGYIIAAGPYQSPDASLADLLFLAQRRVLIGLSIYYPAPGSPDYALCESLQILPTAFACMRSSALPLSHTTTRLEAVTLLRLARLLNFMKSLTDHGLPIPDPSPVKNQVDAPQDRLTSGSQVLSHFLHDGEIRGFGSDGRLFQHTVSTGLTRLFLKKLKSITIRGCR